MRTLKFQQKSDQIIDKLFLRFIPDYVRPNYFSFLRIALVPYLYIILEKNQLHYAFFLFVIAASTDFIDGALARTRNQITDLGKILDPIADKMLILTVLVFIGFQYLIVKVFVVVILFEVVGVLTQALFARYLGRPIPANVYGKIKMVLQSVCVGLFIIGLVFENTLIITVSEYILAVALVFAIISGILQSKKAYTRQRKRRKGLEVKY